MKICALTLGLLMLCAGMAVAADIDGKWEGKIAGPDGGDGFPVAYTFKAEGAVLTGSTTVMDNAINIKDGKIDGNNISFTVIMDFGGQEMKSDYKGVLSGDSLKLSSEMMGQPMEFTLKRAK